MATPCPESTRLRNSLEGRETGTTWADQGLVPRPLGVPARRALRCLNLVVPDPQCSMPSNRTRESLRDSQEASISGRHFVLEIRDPTAPATCSTRSALVISLSPGHIARGLRVIRRRRRSRSGWSGAASWGRRLFRDRHGAPLEGSGVRYILKEHGRAAATKVQTLASKHIHPHVMAAIPSRAAATAGTRASTAGSECRDFGCLGTITACSGAPRARRSGGPGPEPRAWEASCQRRLLQLEIGVQVDIGRLD